jgi:hypothetical protein
MSNNENEFEETKVNTAPRLLDRIPVTFMYEGNVVELNPKEDMTPDQIIQVMMLLMGSMLGESIDTTNFIKKNNLEKHFGIEV